MYQTDLESQRAANAAPIQRAAFISQHHEKQRGAAMQFFPMPPMTARTFSFFTQSLAQNSRVLGTDWKRRGLLIQNQSAQSIFMSVGSEAGFDGSTFTDAIEIMPNSAYEFPANAAPVNDVYIVSQTAGAHVVLIESTMAGTK